MASTGAQFSHLHQLLLQLKEVQDQLARGPKQIQQRQARQSAAEEALAKKEAELKETRATIDRKNLDLRSKEAHLLDLQTKLNQAASNREYDIIRGQLEADKAAKSVLEDEILEWLDRLDALQKEVAACHDAIKEARNEVQRFASEFEAKSVTLREEESKLKVAIEAAEKFISTEVRPQYRRVIDAYGADGLASSHGGVCNQCYVALTAQNRVALNSGHPLFCPSCGRLIYPEDSGT
jgi:Zn-ribbon protein, possibly nucleic acid-binding